MLVATALCADRGLAAPSGRAFIETPANTSSRSTSWIEKLSRGLSRSVAVVLPRQDQRSCRFVCLAAPRIIESLVEPVHPAMTTFEFRLPPPSI